MKLLTDSLFAQHLTNLISFLRSRYDDKLTCLVTPANIDLLEQVTLGLNDQDLCDQLTWCIEALAQPSSMRSSIVFDSPDSLLRVAELLDQVIIGLKQLPNTTAGGLLETTLLDKKDTLKKMADHLAGFITIVNEA